MTTTTEATMNELKRKLKAVTNSRDHFIKENKILKEKLDKLPTESLFSDMTVEPYGKGYLLVPPEEHSDYGTKYYHNGWWNENNDAWFFKKEHRTFLLNNMATLVS